MNEHDATEIAFKNGYKKGRADAVREFAERLKVQMHTNVFGENFIMLYEREIDKIAKEQTESVK